MLSGLIILKNPSTDGDTHEKKRIYWNDFFHCIYNRVEVCQLFLCQLLQISKDRFLTVQKKLISNESPEDKRGTHLHHEVKSTDKIQTSIRHHCLSLSHSEFQYSSEKCKLLTFDNPELPLTTLYKLFIEYYADKNENKTPPLLKSADYEFFNYNSNFTFNKPRTDVCNFCYENEDNVEIADELKQHKIDVKLHNDLRQKMINDEKALCMEFDFGQNLALPKISVNEQFYKRLLWLNISNINVFRESKNSYMYLFTEGNLKKGPCEIFFMTL